MATVAADGTVTGVGQVRIRSAAVPAATVYIFHVAPDAGRRAERDAAPLQCDGEAFLEPGSLQNWVELN